MTWWPACNRSSRAGQGRHNPSGLAERHYRLGEEAGEHPLINLFGKGGLFGPPLSTGDVLGKPENPFDTAGTDQDLLAQMGGTFGIGGPGGPNRNPLGKRLARAKQRRMPRPMPRRLLPSRQSRLPWLVTVKPSS